MRLYNPLSMGLILGLLATACSQTETTRTDEIAENDAGIAEREPSETDQIIEMAEDHIRTAYEGQGFTVERAEMAQEPSGNYSGEAVLVDPTTNDRIPLHCTANGVDGGFEDMNCVDTRPNGGQSSVVEADTAIRSEDPSEMRDEIVRDMRYSLNGAGRMSRLIDYSQDGDTVSATFETTYDEGNRSVESLCSGTLRTAENGGRALAYTCRRPL